MVMLPITLVLAGALALLNVALAVRVGQVRHGAGVSVGHGGHEPLERRMRAHANFAEYAPFVLALVGLVEFARGPSWWLAALAGLFVAGRIAHAIGMDGAMRLRVAGTAVTFTLLVGLGVYAVVLPFVPHRPGHVVGTVVPAG